MGPGSGVFATKLAEYFQHVHVSNSNASFIKHAREVIDRWFAEKWWKARFTFSVTQPETANEAVAKRSVDLTTLMQCAHLTDQEAMIHSVADSLTSKATLAIVQINPAPYVIDNDAVKQAVDRLFAFWGENTLETGGGPQSLMGTTYLPQGNAGTHCVPLPDELFIQDSVQRFDINVRERGRTPHAIPGQEHLVMPSQATSEHEKEEFSSDEDAEGAGWRQEVGVSWFRGLLGTMEQKSRLHLYETHLKEVERVIRATSAIGVVEIEWTVSLLLATRR